MRAPLRVRTQVRVLEAAKGGRRPAVICAVLRTKLAGTAELKLPKEQVSPQSMASSLCTEDILSRISLYGGGGGGVGWGGGAKSHPRESHCPRGAVSWSKSHPTSRKHTWARP